LNVVKATMLALTEIESPMDVAQKRGISVKQVQPFWSKGHASIQDNEDSLTRYIEQRV
jgi:hypothetical protein